MKPTERFSQTVQDYVKYRPSYPRDIVSVLETECGLTRDAIIADVGSGTGFLAKLFLDKGNMVYGVEPNQDMRVAGEQFLLNYSNFISVDGSAERTHLEAQSVDFVTVGTAFHWFDAGKTKTEFQRILKEPGWVLLVWNVRDLTHSAMVRDYENLLIKYCHEYNNAAREFDHTATSQFFAPFKMQEKCFRNVQMLDWMGFKGRLLSASYSLRAGDRDYEKMMSDLKDIFDCYQSDGQIEFLYSTKLYYGRLR